MKTQFLGMVFIWIFIQISGTFYSRPKISRTLNMLNGLKSQKEST